MPVKVPSPQTPKVGYYGEFLGVDYSVEAPGVARSRAADMLNMISDKGTLPEKRLGFSTIMTFSGKINGLFYGYLNGEKIFITHAGGELYRFNDMTLPENVGKSDKEKIGDNLSSNRSVAFFMTHENQTKLFILTGNEYMVYDGVELKNVEEIATVPLVNISKNPDGTGGAALQAVNLLTPWRREGFLSNGEATLYQLSTKELDESEISVKLSTAEGESELHENTDFTVNRTEGQINFNSAPPLPTIIGQDNVEIKYAKTTEGYADRIKKCTIFAYFGPGGSNRVFLSGNDEYRAWDFWCEYNDPTYFSDLSYSILGSENTKVMGYAKIGEYLLIVKEDNSQDSTIFLRSAELVDGEAVFPIKQGVTGVGAIAPMSFATLIDEPLFLSRTGIYAVTSNMVTAERTLQRRSYFIDAKLTKEDNMQNAIACEYNGYYMLGLNGKVFLLDSRQKTSSGTEYSYECYVWDNIPATAFLAHEGNLYFGCADGRLCKLNTHIETMQRYSDDGEPINAYWDTPADDDGAPSLLKNMAKKGGLLTIKPSYKTGADIYVSVDGEPWELLCESVFSLIKWDETDFENFTFFATETPKKVHFNSKVKKYNTLQFRIQNNKVNQSLGISEINKYFTIGNYRKG